MRLSNRSGVFVCLIGIDGSGKSTQANLLKDYLIASSVDAIYAYHRSKPWLLKFVTLAGEKILMEGEHLFHDYDQYENRKKRLFTNRIFFWLYRMALMLDYLVQTRNKISLPLNRGQSIVCDRYYFDTIVTDFAPYARKETYRIDSEVSFWSKIFPTPDVVILIDIDEGHAYERKKDIPSERFLKVRRTNYLAIVEQIRATVISGDRSIESIHAEIVGILGPLVERSRDDD
jgi:dTMP kinase